MIRRLWAMLFAMAAPLLLAVNMAAPAYATHTTRVNELQKTGVNPWLMALSMGGIVLLLIVFAAIVLFWEHNDRQDENGEASVAEPEAGSHPSLPRA